MASLNLESICHRMELRRDVFQAIADPTRREILALVAGRAMTPGSLAIRFKATRQTISRHIQILVDCELLEQKKSGRQIFYRLNPEKFKEITDFIQPFRKLFDDKFSTLEELMKYYDTESGW